MDWTRHEDLSRMLAKRPSDRRKGDRRKVDLPVAQNRRSSADQRSGKDRRLSATLG